MPDTKVSTNISNKGVVLRRKRTRADNDDTTKPAITKDGNNDDDGDDDDANCGNIGKASAPPLPPPAGKRLLPHVVEELASTDPEGIWLSVPSTPDPDSNSDSDSESRDDVVFGDITYRQLAHAVDRVAWWIHERIGSAASTRAAAAAAAAAAATAGGGGVSQTLAYLGPTDSRYLILIIAAIKVGHRLLLPSTRNADIVQRRLLKDGACNVVLCAASERQKVDAVIAGYHPESAEGCDSVPVVFAVPEQSDILAPRPSKRYVYNEAFEEKQGEPFLVLHTSGTSGDLAPIELPHSYYAYEDSSRTRFTRDGVLTFAPLRSGVRCLYTGPLYHAGAILFTLMKSLFLKVTMLLLPAETPVTAELIERCIILGRASMLGTAPSILEELFASPTRTRCMKNLTDIFCGSGPMPDAVGNALGLMDVKLHHIYGSTETGLLPELPLNDPATNWKHFRFHPKSGVTFRPVGKDDLHELVIERSQDNPPQPCFQVFPNLQEYHTKDVFSRHASQRDLWKFEGRLDDIITFTNGEKFCPSAAEELIASHPDIAEALIVGQGHFQPVLVINMRGTSSTTNEALNNVWPVIAVANSKAPGYAQICKHSIVMTHKPFSRTDKGTVRRNHTEELLRPEIDAVYQRFSGCHTNTDFMLDLQSRESIQGFLLETLSNTTSSARRLSPESDLPTHGLDSLKVAEMVGLINASMKLAAKTTNGSVKKVGPPLFYQNRTVSKLTAALHAMINDQDVAMADLKTWEEDRGYLLERYSSHHSRQPELCRKAGAASHLPDVVMLTGSTGSLGGHILHFLLQNQETMHIYCLDRSPNAKAKYQRRFSVDEHMLARVTFLHVPYLDADRLGVVNEETYARLLEDVSIVIHNAWPVNFNIPLRSPAGQERKESSFECHIAGVCRMIEFTIRARRNPRLVFISGLVAVLGWAHPKLRMIPERVVKDSTVPLKTGYSRSKWLAEQLLDRAAQRDSLMSQPRIIRMGQIAGPSANIKVGQSEKETGTWAASEFIPSIVRSSATIKALPESLYGMEKLRWIPVDHAARIIVEISARADEGEQELGAATYNVTNTEKIGGSEKTWKKDMLPMIKTRLERTTKDSIELVPMQEWLSRVEECGVSARSEYESERNNPAIKLIGFYESLIGTEMDSGLGSSIEMDKAKKASKTLRDLQPVNLDWMKSWMRSWGL